MQARRPRLSGRPYPHVRTRLYQAAPPPRVLQLTRGGHVQTFAEPLWREVMLRFLDDPKGMTSLPRLAEIADPHPPISATSQPESP